MPTLKVLACMKCILYNHQACGKPEFPDATVITMKLPAKLVGEVSWVGGADSEIGGRVREGIWRSKNKIALDCASSGYEYDVQLSSKDGLRFEGRFSDKSRTSDVVASATLYTNSEGMVLFGRWLEDGSEYRWWAEVRKVSRFPHEAD